MESNNPNRKDWRKDYVLITTWNKEFEMTRSRYVHISVENPLQYVLDFFPDEVAIE